MSTATNTEERRGVEALTMTRPMAVAGWAGILGPILFTVTFLATPPVKPAMTRSRNRSAHLPQDRPGGFSS